MPVPESLLSARLLKQLEQLELRAGRRSRSAGRGERRSRARGQSVEFADHRSYVAGDDVRRLDWNLYGRLDRLFIKLYEEEREMPVEVFLDASESMAFGEPTKFAFGRQLTAALGYVALCGFDRVTVRVFPEPPIATGGVLGEGGEQRAIRAELRGVQGKKSASRFFENLGRVRPGGAADFNESLRVGALQSRRAGLAVVVSDLLDPEGYTVGLDALLGRGYRVEVIQILAREELEPSTFGDLRLVDSETGGEQEVSFGRYRLKAYRQVVESYVQKLREYCRARGIGYYRVASDTSLEALLLKEMREGALLA